MRLAVLLALSAAVVGGVFAATFKMKDKGHVVSLLVFSMLATSSLLLGVDKNLVAGVGEIILLSGATMMLAAWASGKFGINLVALCSFLFLLEAALLANGNLKLKGASKYLEGAGGGRAVENSN